MIHYKHFAIPNLYLANGYEEIHTEDGLVREYRDEDALEQCVRRILLRFPRPLRGWDLRFLRNGLAISQSEFGQMIGRDAQTVARWEKSSDEIPKFVDVLIRAQFAAKFEPTLSVKDVLSFSEGTSQPLGHQIILTFSQYGWKFNLQPRIEFALHSAHSNTVVHPTWMGGAIYKVSEGPYLRHSPSVAQEELTNSLPENEFFFISHSGIGGVAPLALSGSTTASTNLLSNPYSYRDVPDYAQ